MHQTQSAGTLHLATPTLPGSARTAGSPFLSHLHARVGESDDESGELSHWFSHTNGNPMSGTIAFYQLGTKNISHS